MDLVFFLADSLCSIKVLQNFFMISTNWLLKFQMKLLFYMSLSSVCLLSIRQLRKLLVKIKVSALVASAQGKSVAEQLLNFWSNFSLNPHQLSCKYLFLQ